VTDSTQQLGRSTRLPRAQRREQLLDVTKSIVGEHGLHAVSIDRVAREAGISRPIVYEHFSDLGGLLNSLLDREANRALDQLAQFMPLLEPGGEAKGSGSGPKSDMGPEDRDPEGSSVIDVLLRALTGYLEAVRSDPVTWRLMLMPPEGAPEFLRERIEQGRAAVVAQLAALIERAYAPQGGQRSPDPELTASSMSALSDHWARLMLTEPERFDLERILEHGRWALARFAPGA
jgi:AcrR family transcriptional regulator